MSVTLLRAKEGFVGSILSFAPFVASPAGVCFLRACLLIFGFSFLFYLPIDCFLHLEFLCTYFLLPLRVHIPFFTGCAWVHVPFPDSPIPSWGWLLFQLRLFQVTRRNVERVFYFSWLSNFFYFNFAFNPCRNELVSSFFAKVSRRLSNASYALLQPFFKKSN